LFIDYLDKKCQKGSDNYLTHPT